MEEVEEVEELDDIDALKKQVLEDVDPPAKLAKRQRRIRAVVRTLVEYGALVVIIFVVFQILMGISYVEGNSMYPTLHDRDMVIYNRINKSYVRGDIVAIEMPGDELYVKRVIAVAGDTVNIEGGSVYVNGKAQSESWSYGETLPIDGEMTFPITISDGEIFVLGDNREVSEDSRTFGPVKVSDTKGRLAWYIGKL